MLDVHLPHPTHAWKDFWIHLGTITVGLLIALGLENGVEALHRLHQRHELEESFRAECEENRLRAEFNFEQFDAEMAWLLGLRRDIDTMLATGGKANMPYRELKLPPRGRGFAGTGSAFLMTSVWDTASATGRLALLPDDEAQSYSTAYHVQGERFQQLYDERIQALGRQSAMESRFADGATPLSPVLSRMSAAQLEEYKALVMQSFTAVRLTKARLKVFYGANYAASHGLYGVGVSMAEQQKSRDQFPDDFEKMEREAK